MNILLACDRLGYDNERLHGAGRLMVDWTRALLARNVEVHTVILREPGLLGQRVLEEGLPFTFLSRHPLDPRTFFDFVRLIRQREIQVAHLQAFGASTFGRAAAIVTGIPTIVHVHADYRVEPKGYPRYVKWVDRLLAPATTKVFAISEAIADFATGQQGFSAEIVEVVHNSLDLEKFRPPLEQERRAVRKEFGIAPEARVAICVSRLDRTKGVDVLVNAWTLVSTSVEGSILLIVGDGPERGALEEAVRQAGTKQSVQFLGYRDDVNRVLRAGDWAVVPSRYEGLSLAALEAMAIGLPVIASDVGGIPEVVTHGENGLLVPPEDEESLAEALIKGLEMAQEDHGSYSLAALKTSSLHDLTATAEYFEQTYNDLAASREFSAASEPQGH